jgi:mannosyltransferase
VALDYAGAADVIKQRRQPGDAAVYDRTNTWELDGGVHYYLPRDLKLRDVDLPGTPCARYGPRVDERPRVRCMPP